MDTQRLGRLMAEKDYVVCDIKYEYIKKDGDYSFILERKLPKDDLFNYYNDIKKIINEIADQHKITYTTSTIEESLIVVNATNLSIMKFSPIYTRYLKTDSFKDRITSVCNKFFNIPNENGELCDYNEEFAKNENGESEEDDMFL